MKSFLPLFCLATIVLIAATPARCGDLQKAFDASHVKSPAAISEKSRKMQDVEAAPAEITAVGMERAGSFFLGSPVYTVIINADGTFTYDGGKNDKHAGKHTGHLATGDVNSLLQYVKEIDFFSLDDNYDVLATDQETIYVTASRNGTQKIVRNYGAGGPLKLWALEQVIEALLAHASWDDSH